MMENRTFAGSYFLRPSLRGFFDYFPNTVKPRLGVIEGHIGRILALKMTRTDQQPVSSWSKESG